MQEEIIKLISQEKIDKKALIKLIPELELMEECECNHPAHCYGVFDHTIESIKLADNNFVKLVLLFHDIGKPLTVNEDDLGITRFFNHPSVGADLTGKILERMGFEENIKNKIVTLIKYHDDKIEVEDFIKLYGEEMTGLLLQVQKADLSTHAEWYRDMIMPYLKELEGEYSNIVNKRKM